MIEFKTEEKNGLLVCSYQKSFGDGDNEEVISVEIEEIEGRVDGTIMLEAPELDYPCDNDDYVCNIAKNLCPNESDNIERCPVATASLAIQRYYCGMGGDIIEVAREIKDMIVNEHDGIGHHSEYSDAIKKHMNDTWVIKLVI